VSISLKQSFFFTIGYNYLGPGTRLEERLKQGIKPINPLDEAGLLHDISYLKFSDPPNRHIADQILEKRALNRVFSSDAKLGERGTALLTASAMRLKRKLGLGMKSMSKSRKISRKKNISSLTSSKMQAKIRKKKNGGQIIPVSKKKKKSSTKINRNGALDDYTRLASAAVHCKRRKKNVNAPCVIPIPKTGGVLPLIPILAGISALGGAASGVSSIVRAVGDVIEAKKKISGKKQIGNGIYLAPYNKKGLGLYLHPYKAKN